MLSIPPATMQFYGREKNPTTNQTKEKNTKEFSKRESSARERVQQERVQEFKSSRENTTRTPMEQQENNVT
jgi:hypothetical protein